MRRILAMVAAGFILTAGIAMAAEVSKEEAATAAARAWIVLVDKAGYGEAWDQASAYFKNAVTKEEWVQSLSGIRNPLGKMDSRILKSATYKTVLPGTPDGAYVVIQFSTSFENKASAMETVTLMLEKDGQWRVAGYYIR